MILKKFNVIATGGSGILGDSAVRQRKSKTQVCKRPTKRPGAKKPAQQATINHFKLANQYATTALADPALRAAYKRAADLSPNLVHARNMAVRDYMRPPEILAIDTDNYTGQPGELLYLLVKDDFMVKSVNVAIYDSRNNLLETGAAVCNPGKKQTQCFVYTITAPVKGCRIVVYAADIPGNVATQEVYTGIMESTPAPQKQQEDFTVADLLKGVYTGSMETASQEKPVSPKPNNDTCFADLLQAAYQHMNATEAVAKGTTAPASTENAAPVSTPAFHPALHILTTRLPPARLKLRTKTVRKREVDHAAVGAGIGLQVGRPAIRVWAEHQRPGYAGDG